MTEPILPATPAAISARAAEAEKLGPLIASFTGDAHLQRRKVLGGAVAVAVVGLLVASPVASPLAPGWMKALCAALGVALCALAFGGVLSSAAFAALTLELRAKGVWISRVRGVGTALAYDSIESATLHEGWHRRLKRRTRWIRIRVPELRAPTEIVAVEYGEHFDAILAGLREHVSVEKA